ncbi:MAG: hypothetical protein KGQ81_08670 [Cyanobacteria bacterium REEB498]|nr:hypothetical protein [Cyanobacteria bacterium REEB498]
MAGQALRLDRGLVGLTLLAGAAMSMGFIQLLAGPLENVANLSVQVLAVQTTAMAAPLVITLLLLLREGPALVGLGTRLVHRQPRALVRRWRHQAVRLIPTAVALLPYLLAAAMVSATLTKPELSSLTELQFLAGNLSPGILVLSLLKTALFAGLVLWITLHQGRRARRLRLGGSAALSRAISLSIAVVLGLDLMWVLLLDPSVSGGGI